MIGEDGNKQENMASDPRRLWDAALLTPRRNWQHLVVHHDFGGGGGTTTHKQNKTPKTTKKKKNPNHTGRMLMSQYSARG